MVDVGLEEGQSHKMVVGLEGGHLNHTGCEEGLHRMVVVVLVGYIVVVGHRIVEAEDSSRIVRELGWSMYSERNVGCFGHMEGCFDHVVGYSDHVEKK